jgi:hypothetical protein
LAIRAVPQCEGLRIPELLNSFSPDCDEEEENTTEETPQPSA